MYIKEFQFSLKNKNNLKYILQCHDLKSVHKAVLNIKIIISIVR